MRTRSILFLIVYIISFKCSAQQKNTSNHKEKEIERFNLKKFTELKINNRLGDTLPDGSIVKYLETKARFQESIRLSNSPRTIHKQFFKDNHILYKVEHHFRDLPEGKTQIYDHSGSLIKEIDNNKPFEFSIADLIKKMTTEFSIDISNDDNVRVKRFSENTNTPYYEIFVYYRSVIRTIRINGITGAVISDVTADIKI